MMNALQQLNHLANRHAGKLLLTGMAAIAWHNWRLWQRDNALLQEKGQPVPLPPLEKWPDLPLVSVLVAAWNEAKHIEAHIESFLSLRYPNKELVLCAGGNDRTYELAKRYADSQIKVYEQQPGEGKQRALYRGFPHTTGEIIFLTDADCELDDESFERTFYSIAAGNEQVCSGSSRPSTAQWSNSFVAAQAASQLYSNLYGPSYGAGLLGRNAAVARQLLEQCKGLQAPAPTGTDYVLAKMLVKSGARIRQVPESRVTTDYPTTASAYLRQQRRWLRNVVLHGRRFGALNEMKGSLQTSLIGLAMLVLPLGGVLLAMSIIIAVWLLLLWHAWLSRLRYLYVVGSLLETPVQARQITLQWGILFLDFIAWSQPLLDYVSAERQKVW